MYKQEYLEKAIFVSRYLFPLVVATGRGVAFVEYQRVQDAFPKERVTVTFDNGYQKLVNVDGDSLRAIVEDVLKAID